MATQELADRAGWTYSEAVQRVDRQVAGKDPKAYIDKDNGVLRSARLTDPGARGAALVELAAIFPPEPGRPTPEEMELSRRRDDDTGTAPVSEAEGPGVVAGLVARYPGVLSHTPTRLALARSSVPAASDDVPAGAKVDDLVDRYPGMLSNAPRRGQTHTAVIKDEDTRDSRQPGRGGVVHPEVERLLRARNALMGLDPNTVHPVKSAAERERGERRAQTTRRGGRSIEELHRSATRSATSSRG